MNLSEEKTDLEVKIPWDTGEARKWVTKGILISGLAVGVFAFNAYVSAQQEEIGTVTLLSAQEYVDEIGQDIFHSLSRIASDVSATRDLQEEHIREFVEFRLEVATGGATKEEVADLRSELRALRTRTSSYPVVSSQK